MSLFRRLTSFLIALSLVTGALCAQMVIKPASGGGTGLTTASFLALFSGDCSAGKFFVADFTCASVSGAFSGITSATNTTAAMVVGSGATLGVSGTGTITATHGSGLTSGRVPFLTTGGQFTDSSSFTYNSGTTTLTANNYFGANYAINGSNAYLLTTSGTAFQIKNNSSGANWMNVLGGNAICFGTSNTACSSTSTVDVKDGTASTGATRLTVTLGAADSASTATVVNAGTTKSAGYQSSDGSAGVTVTTCTAFKNGLCTAGS